MKVAELEKGMWLQPETPYRWVFSHKPTTLCVFRGTDPGPGSHKQYAVYLGQRSDLDISHHVPWSNRYCLFEGQILPVDCSDWPYIQPAE